MSLLAPLLFGIGDIGGEDGGGPPPPTSEAVALVVITPLQFGVAAGQFTELVARYYDQNAVELTGRAVAWSSSDPLVATVSPAGVVIGHSSGTVTITATVEGVSTTATGTVVSITVPGPPATQPSIWTPAGMLERCRRMAGRPDTDAATSDADWYAYLTEAEAHYVQQIAVHCPEVLYGPSEKMTTLDGGLTYYVQHYPLGRMEIRESRTGRVMRPSAEWAHNDYVPEGQQIRFPHGMRRTFHDGPYARYVRAPWEIHAGQGSQLPDIARRILVYHAVVLWATRGGYRNPGPFEVMERKAWSGDPNVPGDTGLLGALKTQVFGSGLVALDASDGAWWRSSDLG